MTTTPPPTTNTRAHLHVLVEFNIAASPLRRPAFTSRAPKVELDDELSHLLGTKVARWEITRAFFPASSLPQDYRARRATLNAVVVGDEPRSSSSSPLIPSPDTVRRFCRGYAAR